MQKYYGDWSRSGKSGLIQDFQIDKSELDGVEILFAYYTYEDYSGCAFVLFSRDGKLYEVNGGHCSCYGLEGQWEPEETTVEAIKKRIHTDYSFESRQSELKEVLKNI